MKNTFGSAAAVRALAITACALLIAGCASAPDSASSGKAGALKKSPGRALAQYSQSGWKNARIVGGGFIPGIIFNTTEQGVAYVRTDMGGAYRWNAADESWIPITDFAGVEDYGILGIASIATDPVEPNRVVLASGTYTNDWDKNGRILVSDDYGKTFTKVDMPFKMGGNMPGRGAGERLAIDPNDNRIVYFGSNDAGLWRSEDYGHTWAEVTSFPTKGNVYDEGFKTWNGFKHFFGIAWVAFDKSSGAKGLATQNLYAGVIDTGASIYESTDAGKTWHPLEGQPEGPCSKRFDAPEGGYGLLTGDWDPSSKYWPIAETDSPDGSMIISYNAGLGPYSSAYWGGAIWRYEFASKKWTDISLPQHDADPSHHTEDRGVGNVAVDWQNPNVLVASTLNEWWPDEYLYRSTDGGKTWDPIWFLDGWPNRVNKYDIDISLAPWLDWGITKELPEQAPKLGWMMHALEIDPFDSNTFMWGTGGTIYGSHNLTDWDKGKKVHVSVFAEGIEECAILDLVSPPEGVPLISGMGDLGGLVHRDLNIAPPYLVTPGLDKPTAAINSIDYASLKPSFIVRMGDGRLVYSTDGADNWTLAGSFIPDADTGWSGTVAVAADASVILWAPGGEKAYVGWSSDLGKNWNKCEGIPVGTKVVADRVNIKKFYGYKDYKFYASDDGAKTFKVVHELSVAQKDEPGEVTASDLTSVLGVEGHLWFAGGKAGLLHSEDGGATWTAMKDFDDAQVVGLGMAKPGADYQALYVNAKISGQFGIYRSDDKGATWVRINDDLHQYGSANSTITGDPRIYGRVYLGTNGRGIQWRDLE